METTPAFSACTGRTVTSDALVTSSFLLLLVRHLLLLAMHLYWEDFLENFTKMLWIC